MDGIAILILDEGDAPQKGLVSSMVAAAPDCLCVKERNGSVVMLEGRKGASATGDMTTICTLKKTQSAGDVPFFLMTLISFSVFRSGCLDLDLESNCLCCLLEKCRDELVVLGSVSTRFNAKSKEGQVVSVLRGSRLLRTLQGKPGSGATNE